MTTITTIPSDSTSVPSPGRRFLETAAGVAVGATLGWFAASAVYDDPAATVEPATAVADTADIVPSPLVMSPDAMTHWAEAVPAPAVSADAAEHWAEADAAQQQREDQAACERLSQGLADC